MERSLFRRVGIDNGTALRCAASAEGIGVVDGQDAVVDHGHAAVGVGAIEENLTEAFLGEVVAGAQIANWLGEVN